MAWELVTRQKYNQDFRGHAELCEYSFTVALPDQLGASFTAQQSVQAHIAELQKQGSIILDYELYEDKLSGTFTTDYLVRVTASASPLAWTIIIIGVIALLAIIAIGWTIHSIKDIAEYSPGLATSISIGIILIGILIGGFLLREFR